MKDHAYLDQPKKDRQWTTIALLSDCFISPKILPLQPQHIYSQGQRSRTTPRKRLHFHDFCQGSIHDHPHLPPLSATLPLFKFPEYWLTAPQITTRPPARMRSNMTSLVEGTRKLSEPHLRQKHWTNIERTWLKESRSYHKFDI